MDEIKNISQENIEEHKRLFLIKIPKTKTAVPRSFTISGQYYDIVKKYQKLRHIDTNTNKFFLNYKKGHCTRQVVGIHKFQKIPQKIAEFLKLENSKEYTGIQYYIK